ncbi:DUF6998 domain-containing protein [Sphingomonas sanguinis]|nr:hypothetical protein [Sphingomonas sanguinis]
MTRDGRSSGMPIDERRIVLPDAVRALVVAHRALVASYAATSLRFTLDGRLVGDIAEATAAEAFGLDLCRVRTPGVDALTRDGRTVQVKSSGIGMGPAFTPGDGRALHLIFLLIDFENAVAHVRYNGLEAPVRAELPEVFGGTKRVRLSRVLALDAAVPEGHRLARVR